MNMETRYRVSADTEEIISQIATFWETEDEVDGDCFEGYDTAVWDVMAKVIKVTHQMEEIGDKTPFSIVGKCASDWDCIVFNIVYSGDEPTIKSCWAEPDSDDEELFFAFSDADFDEIPAFLEDEESYTFKEAYEEDVPLGGFLDVSYEEWVDSILQ
jgi:hypothetical protein